MQFTARQIAKLDTRKRIYSRNYALFDYLPEECRKAHREDGGWNPHQLRRCKGRVCNHTEKPSIPY